LFVVWGSGVATFHDPDSGRLLRVITATAEPDTQSLYLPVIGADDTTYMGMSVEDSWYSCEMVNGTIVSLTADGEFTTIGPGGVPQVSVDGSRLAYIRSSDCRPDPQQPDFSFVAVSDTVVVRDLATGSEHTWTFPGAYDDGSLAQVVSSVVWFGDSLLATVKGRLVRLDPSDPAVPADGVEMHPTTGEASGVYLLGARADGVVVAEVYTNGAADRLIAVDPTSGDEVAEIATFEPPVSSTGVDRSGTRWATITDNALIVDGKETVLEVPPPPDGFDTSFEDRPSSVGW
jgi:hypothetical protein